MTRLLKRPRRRTRFLQALGLLAAWALLTLGSAWAHMQVFGHETAAEDTDVPLLIASNIAHLMTGPAWVLLRVMSGNWGNANYRFLLFADGMGWAFWAVGLVVLLNWRAAALRWWARRRTKSSLAIPADLGRRRFLFDIPLLAAGAGASGLAFRSAAVDPWLLETRRYTVPICDLPSSLEGLRLVQLSDTHLGPRIPASFIREAVRQAMVLKPDAFLLTGDYIHQGPRFIQPAAALFAPLVATGRPVIGTLGNHDWYGDGRAMTASLRSVGVHMVDNAHVFLDSSTRAVLSEGEPGKSLCIAGLGDLLTDFISVRLALGGVDPATPRLVLAHNPDTAEATQCVGHAAPGAQSAGTRPPRIDLMISGHTHGGQVRLPLIGTPMIPSQYGTKYAGGLVQGPAFPVLISRGVGMSLLPVRFNVPPEIVEITLRRA
jgi:predicted MPP superfamily phosphohydrolase